MGTKAFLIFTGSLLVMGLGPLIFFETLCPKAELRQNIAWGVTPVISPETKQPSAWIPGRSADKEQAFKHLFSIWNGACKPLEQMIRDTIRHPGSYKHLKTRYKDCGDHLRVTMSFCSKNALGEMVKKTVSADVDPAGGISTVVGLTDKPVAEGSQGQKTSRSKHDCPVH